MQHSNNYYLEKNKTIRQIISVALLLLFVVNITPKKTLHLLFGCHKEMTIALHDNKGEQVTTKNFHCSCNQADIQTPFVETRVLITFVVQHFNLEKVSHYKSILFLHSSSSNGLRGPPVSFG